MNLRGVILCATLAASASAGVAAEPPQSASEQAAAFEAGPAIGWVFPLFSDNEGYRLYTLRGSTARFVNKDRIDVTGFSAVVFSGDASERVETVLLSPEASFFPKTHRASGNGSVRVIHGDTEITGGGWSFDRDAKKVSLQRDVRVTFQAQLNDILK